MAIAYVSSGAVTAAAGSASAPTPAYPAGMSAGNMMVLFVGTKPYTAVIATPTGWTPQGTTTNGTTATGNDVGSTKIAVFTKVATGSESGNLTLSITSTPSSSWAQIMAFSKGTGNWEVTTGVASDTTSDTSFSAAFTTNPGITSGDYLVLGAAGSTDAAQTWSSSTVTASGATITAPTLVGQPLITTGNQSGGRTGYAPVTAGTATAAPTWAATLSTGTNALFSVGMVRLREATAKALAETLTDDFTTQDNVKWSNWDADRSIVSGRLSVNAATSYPAIQSADTYDLTGSQIVVEVPQVPTVGTGSTEAWLYASNDTATTTNAVAIIWTSFGLQLADNTNGVRTNVTIAYDSTAHRWWKIRESGGSIFWDTSPDGIVWTNRRTAVINIPLTSLTIGLMAGDYGTNTISAALFDNYNTLPLQKVALRAGGNPTGGTAAVTAVNPIVPTGTMPGDLSVMTVTAKPFDTVITTPSGWTKITEATNGTDPTTAADNGSTLVAVYVKESAAVGAIGNLTQSGANSMAAAIHSLSKDPSKSWDYSMFTTGSDTTSATTWSVTGGAVLPLTTGDAFVVSTAGMVDSAGFSGSTVTATGMTHSGLTSLTTQAITTGNDHRIVVVAGLVTAGPATTVPVYTATASAATTGTTIFLGLRQGDSVITRDNVAGTGSGNASATTISAFTVTAIVNGSSTGTGTASATTTADRTANGTSSGTGTATVTGSTRTVTSNGTGDGTGPSDYSDTYSDTYTGIVVTPTTNYTSNGSSSGTGTVTVDGSTRTATANGTTSGAGTSTVTGSTRTITSNGTGDGTGPSDYSDTYSDTYTGITITLSNDRSANGTGDGTGTVAITASTRTTTVNGTSTGTGTSAAIVALTATSNGSTNGTGTSAVTTFTGTVTSNGTSSGTASATVVGQATGTGTSNGSGSGTATATANSVALTTTGNGTSTGSGTATTTAVGGSAVSSGTSSGTGTSTANSVALTTTSNGSSIGSSLIGYSDTYGDVYADIVVALTATANGTSSGTGTADAESGGSRVSNGTSTGTGVATANSVDLTTVQNGTSVGANTATVTGSTRVATANGSSTGTGTANPAAISNGTGSGTASATTASVALTATSNSSSVGTGTAVVVTEGTQTSNGSSTGAGTVTALSVNASTTRNGTGSGTGTVDVTGSTRTLFRNGTSTGTGTVTGNILHQRTFNGTSTGIGVGQVNAVVLAVNAVAGSSVGTGTAAEAEAVSRSANGTSNGTGTASVVTTSRTTTRNGTSSGNGTATALPVYPQVVNGTGPTSGGVTALTVTLAGVATGVMTGDSFVWTTVRNGSGNGIGTAIVSIIVIRTANGTSTGTGTAVAVLAERNPDSSFITVRNMRRRTGPAITGSSRRITVTGPYNS